MSNLIVPASWPRTRARFLFREVVERHYDLPLASVTKDGGVEFRDDLDISVWNPAEDDSSYKRVLPGDFVIGLRSFQSGIGFSRIAGLVSPAYTVLRPIQPIEHRYFKHYFKSDVLISQLENVSQGIRQGRTISTESFYNLKLPVPSDHTQRAIADFLDTETVRIDTLIEKKRKQSTLIDLRWIALVTDLVRRRRVTSTNRRASGVDWIGDLPEEWGTPSVGMMFDVELGKMLNQRAAEGENQRPYLRNQNVQWDSFNLNDVSTMHFDPDESGRYTVRKGDLLVCEGGDVGRAAMWSSDEEIHYQKALHRVRPRTTAPPRFLMYVLWAASSLGVFTIEGNQSTIVHLTREQLRAHRIPWPSEVQQRQIVTELDAARAKMRKLQERWSRQIELLTEHRQALITAAVTGGLEAVRA